MGAKVFAVGRRVNMERSELWYCNKLKKYFEQYFSEYEETIEYFVDPAPNQWKFKIPELGVIVKLTCTDTGVVTELREKYK